MLVLRSAAPQAPAPVEHVPEPETAAAEFPVLEPPPRPSPYQRSATATVNSSPAISRIRELIDDDLPHTWVFTGDAFGFETRLARRSWTEHFQDMIRDRLARGKDVVLDTSTTGSSVAGLLRNLDWQVLRFQPDAVVISAGADDVLRAQANRDSLQAALTELTELLQHEGCVAILCSPPVIASASSEQMEPLLETLNAVATECQAVFVNHYHRWYQHQKTAGSILDLLNGSGTVPSAAGHRKLARDLIQELKIGQL